MQSNPRLDEIFQLETTSKPRAEQVSNFTSAIWLPHLSQQYSVREHDEMNA